MRPPVPALATLLAALLLSLAASAPLRAQDPPPDAPVPAAPGTAGAVPEIDLAKVTPEELGGQDPRELLGAAHEAYQAGDYAVAARAFVRALRASPGDAHALYNLACCYGLLDHAKQAARFLEASWRAGFRDLAHIRRDPDFDRVRDSEAFRGALERLAADALARQRRAGTRLPVATRVMAEVRVLEPARREPGRRYPLLLGLHGFGSNGEDFANLFLGRGIEAPCFFCVVQAPYALPARARPGYSWTLSQPGGAYAEAARSLELSVAFVLDVLDAVKARFPVDERNVYLLGFSQGAGLAFSVGMRHPERFRGVIPVGGWLDPAEHPPERVAKAARRTRFLVCHSPEDRVVAFDRAEEAQIFLEENRIPHRLLRYAGGHSVPEDLLRRVLEWMEDPRVDADTGSDSK